METEVVVKRRTHVRGLVVAISALVGWFSAAGAAVLVELGEPRPDDVMVRGFRLDSTQEITISDRGFGYRSGGRKIMLSNAWILDASDRDVKWEMRDKRRSWKDKAVGDEKYVVELPKGEYEFYYSTYAHREERKWGGTDGFFNIWDRGIDDVIDKVLDNEDVSDVDDLYRRFGVRVEGAGTPLDENAVEAIHDRIAGGSIVSIRKLGDHEYVQRGFELKRSMKVHIHAIGEAREDGVYDYGWIINADTGERVWKFSYGDSYHAGGAMKNREIDSVFEAPAGRYVAVYGTDDSHSWERWNSAPPFDPAFWGMTLGAENPGDGQYAGAFEYEGQKLDNVIVELTRVGDDEYVHKGFTLSKPMKIRVYALGEGRDGEMYDHGWIVDTATRERVWEMDYRDTEHGGGADKNRVFDGIVPFAKGSYIVYYGTDDSHAYPHWNTEPPMDRERWGITLMGAEGYAAGDVSSYTEEENGDYLVRMTEMRDDEYRFETFEIKERTSVGIYAVGEGTDGRMYDYGWIEDAESGRVVWEMTYRKTRHAGGAKKNRMFVDTVVLEPGKYKVFYETDDSHSFRGWNSAQPYEPSAWGITVRATKNG
jgi:hypothetical protein